MPATVVIGGQWGDEGKGRIVDLLAQRATIVARYSAGNNAGHTVINHLGTFKLNLVPAGIFYADKTCIIGNGMALDVRRLLEEIEQLEARGVSTQRLRVSDRAHVIMPWHPIIDRLDEELRGPLAVGTTGRGVGPAFADKVGRIGVRVADLVDGVRFPDRLRYVLDYKNRVLTRLYEAEPLDYKTVLAQYQDFGARLEPFVADTAVMVQQALDRGEEVLLEGAQGALLDLDFGTYEFVTSSVPSSSAAGAALGIGIGPNEISRTVGVYKAYQTRVGGGPMPTELFDEVGAHIADRAQEFGTTTGRARRCGWFDAVAAAYTRRLNGLTSAVVTRLDVLDDLPEIKICTAYQLDGVRIDTFPASSTALAECGPVLETLPGWQQPTSDVRRFADLPAAAQGYVRRIEELLGCPVDLVSVGPEREQAIWVREII
ncbi:MAG TPA: adenylosuccinate synthase [Chloroflexota bacterium]|jgi:adenylosuccinate synthase|nr:adenylosuccinate synthase [Chloroflexota bacterium]